MDVVLSRLQCLDHLMIMMMGTEWNLLMGTDWMALQKAWHCNCWSVLLMVQQMVSQMDARAVGASESVVDGDRVG